jgi:hypothetical protein
MLSAFLRAKYDRFFWNLVFGGQMANKFSKKCTNLSSKFGVLIVDEIELQFFGKMLCKKTFGEIDP